MVEIRTVAVLGAGVMGAQIAALLANAGLTVLLFDQRRDLALKGLERLATLRPPALLEPKMIRRITALGMEEDSARLDEVDWVCEAIPELLEAKQALFHTVAPIVRPGTLLSTNTSGLPAESIAQVIPPAHRPRFLVTHFFNPPRYLRLLELVALPGTDPAVMQAFAGFARTVLGKGVVEARPTPNFIANRIGVFGMQRALQLALEHGLTVEETDALTGPLLGRPKSATFRTADVVGLDTLLHVTRGTFGACAADPWRNVFQPAELLVRLVEEGRLGQKSGSGFYRKEGSEVLQLDLHTLEYVPLCKPRFDSLKVLRRWKDLGRRVEALYTEKDRAGNFLRALLGDTLAYAAWHVGEIADGQLERVDRALRWGFGWESGPFELWDAIGVRRVCIDLRTRGVRVAPWLDGFLASGSERLYRWSGVTREVHDPLDAGWRTVDMPPGEVDLEACRRAGGVLHRGWSASLVDIGGGVACLPFHSVLQPTLNPIDESVIDMLGQAMHEVGRRGFRGLVIGHEGANFCAGANLQLILRLARGVTGAPSRRSAGCSSRPS
jgi:3-hydroxyacyl-CoA dehydrogenase